MTDLRTAAQQALDYWEQVAWGDAVMADKMDALRAALAQQAEPVACSNTFGCRCPKHFAVEQAEPVEPVGAAGLFTLAHLWAQQCYFKGLGRPCDIDSARGAFEQALKAYTAPPQLKPLTDEDILRVLMLDPPNPSLWPHIKGEAIVGDVQQAVLAIVRAVERALEEKNRGR